MAVESLIDVGLTPFQLTAGPSAVGTMSDGTLVFIGPQFGTSNFLVKKSTDNGVTWTTALLTTFPVGSYLNSMGCLIQNDTIYVVSTDSTGIQYRLKRIDYSGGLFTVAVSNATVFSDLATASASNHCCLRKLSNGRLWCVRNAYDNADAKYKIQAAYSDDNGATWTFSATLNSNASSSLMVPFVVVFENNLVVAYPNGTNIQTQSRLHTDPTTSWSSPINQLTIISGISKVHGASVSRLPSKNALIVANDSSSSGTMIGMIVTESGSTLSYMSLGITSITSSGTVVSGRSDGWRVTSLRSADTTHLRVHIVSISDIAWPSSSDTTIMNAFDDPASTSTITSLLNTKDDGSDLTTWYNFGSSQRVNSLTFLPIPMSIFSFVIPVVWYNLPAFFFSMPATWTSNTLFQFVVPVQWLSSFSFFVYAIPSGWTGNLFVTHLIPTSWQQAIPQTFQFSAAITWTALVQFQYALPAGWTVTAVNDLWLVISSPQGDSWLVLPTVAEGDTWTPLTPPTSDTWI